MIFSINLKKYRVIFVLVICSVIIASFVFGTVVATSNTPKPIYAVVIDAGHGGVDGGSTGATTGITERELNLIYANKIEKYLKACNINVVQTRTTMNGLYDYYDDDFKQRDMEKRKEIIDKINPDLVVSIHMNKFADSSQNGAQVFYAKDNKGAENLANSIRDELVKKFENARKLTLAGDYYMTNCTEKPSVIVECGFLSNPQEEANLIDEDYQNKMSYAIFCGIMHYFLTNYGVEM